ncbi:MAG: hypothetical protein U1E83_00340 [Methylotetracoccus sp.]
MNMRTSIRPLALMCLLLDCVAGPQALAEGDGPTGGAVGSQIPDKDRLGATDVYLLACPPGTRSARAAINEGNNPDAPLSVQMVNPHGYASTENAVAGGLSPQAILHGGPGAYLALVHKNGPGTQGYTITVDCYDAAGERIPGDQATRVQNQ